MKINEIEKNVKIPIRNSELYPLEKMEIDDSFLIERTDEETLRQLARRVQPVIFYYNKHNKKFISRTIKAENGIRVWRVK